MRYTLLFIFLFPFFLLAQPFQGQKFIGGTVGISSQSVQDGAKSTDFNFSPSFGGMVSHRVAIGASLGYSYKKASFGPFTFVDPFTGMLIFSNSESRTSTIKIEPFVTWYYPVTGKFGFNLLAGIGWGFSRVKSDQSFEPISEQYLVSARLSPSLYYFASNKLSITASLGGLNFSRTFSDQLNDVTNFDFSLHSGPTFGVRYFWDREDSEED